MSPFDIVFYILAIVVLVSAFSVLVMKNPIYCALSLAGCMIGVAGLFYQLDARFIAGVQLIVYAGAVMVLFVMVIMLFDLKHEGTPFTRGLLSGALKLAAIGAFCGVVAVASFFSTDFVISKAPALHMAWTTADVTKDLAAELFSKYLFPFEVIGVLMLVIAIGAVALARSVGGTHAD